MLNSMGLIKTTTVTDEETWNEFKRYVSFRCGNLGMASLAIEDAIKSLDVVELLRKFSEPMGSSLAYIRQ